MKTDLPLLPPISVPYFYPIFDSESWFERLLPLVQLSPRPNSPPLWVQLRVKGASPNELRHMVRKSKHYCAVYGCELIINDYWRIALDEGCSFVHLGQEDLDSADMSALRRAHVRVGISTHSWAELARAKAHQADYIALGPIYPTRLKAMKWDPQGLARLSYWKRCMGSTPLIAIGGITVERAKAVWEAGANTISVVTDILGCDEPEKRFHQWLQLTP